jgi:hypothetical protein
VRAALIPQGVQLVKPLDEEQVSELLNDRERIRDAAGPQRVPYLVYLGFEFTCNHTRLGSPFIYRAFWLRGLLGFPWACRLGRVFEESFQVLAPEHAIAVCRIDVDNDPALVGPFPQGVLADSEELCRLGDLDVLAQFQHLRHLHVRYGQQSNNPKVYQTIHG